MLHKSLLLSERSEEALNVRQARERVHAGDDPDPSLVRPLILESWQRSRSAGVNKSWGASSTLSDIYTVRESLASADLVRDQRLIAASEPVMRLLSEALSDRACILMLTDASCRTAQWMPSGINTVNREAEFIIDSAGGWWPEERVGTDAASLCHLLGEPVQVYWYEHYSEGLDHWTGTACPIRDPITRRLIGTINIFSFRCVGHPQTLELAQKASALIESNLALIERQVRLHLLEAYEDHICRYPDDPIVCLTPQGRIVGLSSTARISLRINGNTANGRLLSSFPNIEFPDTEVDLASIRQARNLNFQCGASDISAEIKPVHQQSDIAGFLLTLKPSRPLRAHKIMSPSAVWKSNHQFSAIVGNALHKTIADAQRIARRDDPVLIFGETGTGKELVAHAIHSESVRSSGPFVPLNCGGMGGELLGAELFGYEEGAFTGAVRGGRQGKLELADQGTLFLDELEAMPLAMQVSLLRFLEEQTIVRVGASKPFSVDVRIVGATNVDLRQLVQTGQFREDLYYRLNVCSIRIPPLRERVEDIGLIAEHILKQKGLGAVLAPDALALLERHEWPGNVRELRNVLVQAVLGSTSQRITASDINISDVGIPNVSHMVQCTDLLNDAERQVLLSTLRRCNGNVNLAAAELNVHRVTLYRKLKRHGLNWSRQYN